MTPPFTRKHFGFVLVLLVCAFVIFYLLNAAAERSPPHPPPPPPPERSSLWVDELASVPRVYVPRSRWPGQAGNLSVTDVFLDHRPDHNRGLTVLASGNWTTSTRPNTSLYCRFANGKEVLAQYQHDSARRAHVLTCPLPLGGREEERQAGASQADDKLAPYLSDIAIRTQHDTELLLVIDRVPYYSPIPPHREPFYLSLCTRIWSEDELQATPQWIEYYVLLGVRHFFIYNSMPDHLRLLHLLRKYIDQGLITVVQWHVSLSYEPNPQHQNHCLHRFAKATSRWMIVCDVDDYIVPVQYDTTLIALLKQYEEIEDIGGLQMLTHIFSGRRSVESESSLLVDIYRERPPHPPMTGSRLILIPSRVDLTTTRQITVGDRSRPVSTSVLRVNRYLVVDPQEENRHLPNANLVVDSLVAQRYAQRICTALAKRVYMRPDGPWAGDATLSAHFSRVCSPPRAESTQLEHST